MACIPIDFGCIAGSAANTMTGGMLDELAKSVLEAVGSAYGALGTAWMMVPSPEVGASPDGTKTVIAGPTSEMLQLETLLGWLKWAGLVVVAASLVVEFINMMVRSHRGEPMFGGSRILTLCAATGLIGAAAPLIGSLFKHPGRASSAVEFLQANLWWLTMFAAVVGVVFAAIRMAMTHRVDPLRTWLGDLIHLAVWSLLGAAIVSIATTALDSLAMRITFMGLKCGDGEQAACFGGNLAKMFGAASAFGAGGMFGIAAVVLGFLALLGSFGQIFLLLVRASLVPLMVGVLPATVAAATTGSRRAKQAQDQLIGWLVGFVFYKLVAGLIYGLGFFMAGTDWSADDGTGILQALSGLVLLVCAVIALPMLMKAVAPAVGAVVGGGAGGGAMGMMAAAIPLGAMGARSLMGAGSKGSGGGGAGAVPQGGGGLAGKSTLTGAGAAGAGAGSGAAAAGGPVGLGVAAAGAAAQKVGDAGAKAAGAMQSAAAASTGQGSGQGSTAPAGATPAGVGGTPTTGPKPTGTSGTPASGGAGPGAPAAGGAGPAAASGGGAAAGAASATGPGAAAVSAGAQAAAGVARAAKGAATSAVQDSTGGAPTPSGSSQNGKG